MRQRLHLLAVSLVTLVLLALAVPLLRAQAEDRTQDLYVERLEDATRFAVLGQEVLETGDELAFDLDLERYVDVHGGVALLVDADRKVIAGTAGSEADQGGLAGAMTRALGGEATPPPEAAWPWASDEIVVATPVGRDANVIGAVVLVAPTAAVKASVTGWLVGVSAAAVLLLALTVFGVVAPFVGWVLRPVRELEDAARALADGELDIRAHQVGPSELQELAGSFNRMADRVQVSQRQQRELIADAAHQLGNPLTALRLRLDSIGAAHPDEVQPVIEETERLTATVDSLLELSMVGSVIPEVLPLDAATEARQRCAVWSPVFEELITELPPSAPVLATSGLVGVFLDAALDNAAKFAPASPVHVSIRRARHQVSIRVADQGPGLVRGELPGVGRRFFRSRQHQNVPGTGLGLAIVRARVEAADGEFLVDSPPQGGLVVTVTLRAADPEGL